MDITKGASDFTESELQNITNVRDLHVLASNHRQLLVDYERCGCFYCYKTFKDRFIKEWIDGKKTALCPYCGIDAVIPMISKSFNKKTLKEMHEYWFKV